MLVINKDEQKEAEFDAVTIYTSLYLPVFIVKNIFTVFVFALGLKSAIQVGHPSYYKPAKWLQKV